MQEFHYEAKVIWAQVDANQHMRHSAYADFAAQARIELLEQVGLSAKVFQKQMLGPILLREELVYYKEVNLSEKIRVTCEMTRCKADASRWSIRSVLFREDGVKAAVILVDGAWMDLVKRKMTGLENELLELFMDAPKSKDFLME
jgi:acyl-CoA thioester hydrolase